jgi:hypothetical protein
MEDTARDERHDDHEEDFVGMALSVAPDFSEKML